MYFDKISGLRELLVSCRPFLILGLENCYLQIFLYFNLILIKYLEYEIH